MRKALVLLGILALVLSAPASAGDEAHHHVKSGFSFGRIAFENEVIAVDIRNGRVRTFVTDAEPGGINIIGGDKAC